MEGGSTDSPIVKYLTEIGAVDTFTLVDFGCSGGISPILAQFGASLRAWGFDPDVNDVERLRQAETIDRSHVRCRLRRSRSSHPFRAKAGCG